MQTGIVTISPISAIAPNSKYIMEMKTLTKKRKMYRIVPNVIIFSFRIVSLVTYNLGT